MSIKDLFNMSKMLAFLKKIFIGGLSVLEFLFTSDKSLLKTTAAAFKHLAITAIRQGLTPNEFSDKIDKLVSQKKRESLTALKGVMSATTHEIKGKFTADVEKWVNLGVMDSKQSIICMGYMGKEWKKWSDLKAIDKPPRHYNCRSKVIAVKKGSKPINQDSLIIQFLHSGVKKQKDYLGTRRFEAWKRGDFEIKTSKQLLRVKSFKLKELLNP